MNRYKGSRQERSRPLMLLVGFFLCVGTVTASGDLDRYDYELLATNRTSTMEKEMNQAAGEGFEHAGQTVFETTFGGKETVVIMEHDGAGEARYEYKLLATKRTSTLQKELTQEGENGFKLAGMTVSRTTFGGEELVSILQRPVR